MIFLCPFGACVPGLCSQQGDIDHLMVNLRIDATMVKEQMHIRWAAETGLVDAIEPIVASYKEIRGLQVSIVYLLLTLLY